MAKEKSQYFIEREREKEWVVLGILVGHFMVDNKNIIDSRLLYLKHPRSFV